MSMNSKMNRGRLTFICVWLAIFAVCYLIWALYLGALTRSLAKYDTYSPEASVEKIFRESFDFADAYKLATYGDLELSQYDDPDAEYKFLALITSGKELSYYEVGELCYEVAAEGAVFARFTIIEDESAKKIFGKRPYILGDTEFIADPPFEANIIAPKGSVVKINGVLLSEKDQTGETLTLDNAPYFPEGDKDSRTMVVYRISGLYIPPEITVSSGDGSISYAVLYDEEASEYSAEHAYRTYLAELYNKTLFG